jgi:hypothetical protein
MAITHTWSIKKLDQLNDGKKIVANVNFEVESTNGTISTRSRGMIRLDTDNLTNPITYEDLTQETILNWVKSKLGPNLGNYEVNNAAWINSVANPPKPRVIAEELPWLSKNTTETNKGTQRLQGTKGT